MKNESKENTLLYTMPSSLQRTFVGDLISIFSVVFAHDVFSIAAILHETFSITQGESKALSV